MIIMPTKAQVIEKYGIDMWNKMAATGWLDGITCQVLPDGSINIPQRDINCAYRAATGEFVSDAEWD
jgi:hypothetical protein